MAQWLLANGPYVAIGIMLILLIVWMVFSIIERKRQAGHMAEQARQLEALMRDENQRLLESSDTRARQDREELSSGLRGYNDSVAKLMSESMRSQQAQLDGFAAQLRAIGLQEEERTDRLRLNIEERLRAYEVRMDKISTVLDQKLQQIQSDNAQKLEQMRVTVDEKLNTTLDRRLGESFQQVSERLEQVYKGLGEMQSLANGVGDLKKVLTNVKTRGVWGEIQLGNLLEQVMTASQYEQNVAVKPGSSARVEFAIRLPSKDRDDEVIYLPIDAKFPQEDYQRLLDAADAGDAVAVEECAKQLEQAVRTQAKLIHDKYIEPPFTTDFAIMFLPVEGLYAEVLRRPGLTDRLQNELRIIVTGPTTLAALLNSLQMGFRTLAIQQRSGEVWRLLGAVKSEFGKFADLLTKTQKRLKQVSESIEDATRKTRTIERKLKNVQELAPNDSYTLLDDPLSPAAEWDEDELA